jgi:hypothetical protein
LDHGTFSLRAKNNNNISVKEELMKLFKILIGFLIVFMMVTSVSIAGDFDWMKDFSIKAEADTSDFKARLSTRFNVHSSPLTRDD